ncbi:MAG: nickel pincer cofactor biosynthesis protein LarC [Proteobacteria bacterium]|nr:nickel pincer cofactor biosynthesis protein LarC [Pseudomonadota bacterium]MBU1650340.1 nickel pincer cofactor biosynthesis protein LarC [Pseudomonadota bacterium]MBU1987011.1 nickel pincer cofactor biosynthesis protein LarC [Pseudomonadota bacterium]
MPTPTQPLMIAYTDCFSGISGDMFLAALLDAGLDEGLLRRELAKLDIGPFDLAVTSTRDSGIKATKVAISARGDQHFRNLASILDILQASDLSPIIIDQASAVFRKLACAEAKVHGQPMETIHFHELGAIDTILDVVGVTFGLHHLGIGRLVSSPLPWVHGFVDCAHGHLPLPAPAVCELLTGVPVYAVDLAQELVTPTGAALLTTFSQGFGPLPDMTIDVTGYGAGSQELSNHQPNLLRLIIGREIQKSETVEVIETHLDDWNSEGFPYLCELLLRQGALDVSLTAMLMKKGRPGQLLRVISSPAHSLQLKQTILSETTAIGLRFRTEARITLEREQVTLESQWGRLVAKKVQTPSGTMIYPEYEACRAIAESAGVPLQQVYREVYLGREIKKEGKE